MSYDAPFDQLNGHKLLAIRHNDDLYIETDQSRFKFEATGD